MTRSSYETVVQNNATYIDSECPFSVIANNTLTGSKAHLNIGADNNVVYGNTIIDTDINTQTYGLSVVNSQEVLVAANNITNSYRAIQISYCGNNIVEANTIANSFIGFSERYSTLAPPNKPWKWKQHFL